MAADPTGGEEREHKFEVTDGFELPGFGDVPDVRVLVDDEVDLVATYYDTSDLRLTRSGASLRHRSDDGWTVKLPDAGGADALVRREIHFDGGEGEPPTPAADLVTGWARAAALRPVATVRTRRHRLELGDHHARPVAEIVDDRVRTSSATVPAEAFREIEIELRPVAPKGLEARLVDRVEVAGSVRRSRRSKVARALGAAADDPPDLERAVPERLRTVRDVVCAAVAASVQRLVDHDAAVRQGQDPEAVHQARVATRRLRSDLKTFRPVLERTRTDPLRDELRWLGDQLGGVRDADVLRAELEHRLDVLGATGAPAADGLRDRLDEQHARARAALGDAMTSARYRRLLEALVELALEPPFSDRDGDERARKRGPRLVRRQWRRVRREERRASDHPTDEQLHEVRKRAKQARYAAEAVVPVAGKPAKRFARAMERVQDHLGDLQDAVVMHRWLRDAARAAGPEGPTVLLAGELAGLCAAERRRLRREWPAVWKRARRRRRRRWLRR
jgi:CHAD domain-containing protein